MQAVAVKMTHGAVFHLLSLDFRDEVMKRLSGKRNVSFNLKKKIQIFISNKAF